MQHDDVHQLGGLRDAPDLVCKGKDTVSIKELCQNAYGLIQRVPLRL